MSRYLAFPEAEQLPEEFEGPANHLFARQNCRTKMRTKGSHLRGGQYDRSPRRRGDTAGVGGLTQPSPKEYPDGTPC